MVKINYIKDIGGIAEYPRYLYFNGDMIYTKHQSDMFPRAAVIVFDNAWWEDVYDDVDDKMVEARDYYERYNKK